MSGFLDSPSFRVKEKEADKKEYTWETSKARDIWEHGIFPSIEKCVEDYLKNYDKDFPQQEVIYVGECERYTFCVNGRKVIDDLEEQALYECGECAESWEPSLFKTSENWNELNGQLTKVVTDWLEKHYDMPYFYSIVNVVEVPVKLDLEE